MKPTLVIVGRPNVGKSTLFNRLTRSRDALVADQPGLTRDRHYGHGRLGSKPYLVVDTGGFEPQAKEGIVHEMARQAEAAIAEADVLIFVVDVRTGLTSQDKVIADLLRRSGRPVLLAANKGEGMDRAVVAAEFYELGCGDPCVISSAHGEGVRELVELALAPFPDESEADDDTAGPRVAIAGRPNVGKSTLINTLLGEERLIAFDQPGTTRDAVAIDFERSGRPYTLVDTAGVRRRGKVTDMIEKFSVVKTLQAIEDCNVCVLMLDALEGVAEQDANIAGYILEAGRALVVAVNKWDALPAAERERLKSEFDRKLHFLRFARLHMISARTGLGVGALMRSVDEACAAAFRKLPTPKLTRSLHEAVERQQPPRRGPVRPKLRYAHQGGQNPPIVIVHGSSLDHVPETYRRYLETWLREQFSLAGTPLRIEFRSGANPYAAR